MRINNNILVQVIGMLGIISSLILTILTQEKMRLIQKNLFNYYWMKQI